MGEEKEDVSRNGLKTLEKASRDSSSSLTKERKEWRVIKTKIGEYLATKGYKRDEARFESDWLKILNHEFGLKKDSVISSNTFTSNEIKKIDDYRFKIEGDLMRRTNFSTMGTISQGPNPYAIPDSVVKRRIQEKLEKLDNILHMWDIIAAVAGLAIGVATKGGRIRDTSSGGKHQPAETFVPLDKDNKDFVLLPNGKTPIKDSTTGQSEIDIRNAIETGKETIIHVNKKAFEGNLRIPEKSLPQSKNVSRDKLTNAEREAAKALNVEARRDFKKIEKTGEKGPLLTIKTETGNASRLRGDMIRLPKMENPEKLLLEELGKIRKALKDGTLKEEELKNKISEAIGEAGARRFILNREKDNLLGEVKVPTRGKGAPVLDLLFETKDGRLIHIEAKGGSGKLKYVLERKFGADDETGSGAVRKLKGELSVLQNTPKWFQDRMDEIRGRGNHRLASKLDQAWRRGKLESYTVKTTIRGEIKEIKDHTIEWKQVIESKEIMSRASYLKAKEIKAKQKEKLKIREAPEPPKPKDIGPKEKPF